MILARLGNLLSISARLSSSGLRVIKAEILADSFLRI